MKRSRNSAPLRGEGIDLVRLAAWTAARRAAGGAPVDACACGCMYPATACARGAA